MTPEAKTKLLREAEAVIHEAEVIKVTERDFQTILGMRLTVAMSISTGMEGVRGRPRIRNSRMAAHHQPGHCRG